MTNDDILKLLGGYATNTLTESERKALFEAALEDQKLFDALQEEEALKELLADADARDQIRRALDEPRRAPWWSRRWVWAPALAATAMGIFAVVMIERPRPIQTSSTNEVAAIPAQQAPPARNIPAPPITEKLPARRVKPPVALTTPVAQEPHQQTSPAMAPRAMAALTSGSLSDSIASPLLGYSLVRRDANGIDTPVSGSDLKPGDVVRIRASAAASGNLALYHRDASGDLRQVFPATGRQLAVAANTPVTLDWPILIQNGPENFRLSLSSNDAALQTVKEVEAAKKLTPSPLLLDIQIGPKN
jgi:hypothetical protein